jgi:NTE family protein
MELPDVLVLGVGGTLGEAWLRALLGGLESASGLDFRGCEYFVGSSAGSIVAASLVGGRRPRAGDRATREWTEAAPQEVTDAPDWLARAAGAAGRLGSAVASPLAGASLATTAPAGRVLRAAALAAAPHTSRTLQGMADRFDEAGVRFDGRLRIAAVDRRAGRRVVFGSPGAPKATVGQAVHASCAVPWVFAPVTIGGREYVDGGVWSPTNLDAAPAGRGSEVLCIVPTAAPGPFRALTSAALVRETLALRGRGATVRTIAPDAASAAAMGPNLMDPSRVEEVLDAAFAQGRALAG